MATDSTIAHYANLANSRAGLVMVEYTYVHLSGRSEENQLGIDHDQHIEGLSKIARTLKRAGSIAGIQLTHAGGKTSRDLTDGKLLTPSGISVPVKGKTLEAGDIMSTAEIELFKEAFLLAVKRAVQAGFDLIEFHAAHGYGLNQWLSPITNQRDDQYGGTCKNRLKLLREIVEGVRFLYPNLLLSVRIPGRDFFDNGLSIEDGQYIARELERMGADIINVSSGIGGWRRPNERLGQGYLVEEASLIQSSVSIPVIGVGGIQDGTYIDQTLSAGHFSLAAVGRAILEAPQKWGELNLNKNPNLNLENLCLH